MKKIAFIFENSDFGDKIEYSIRTMFMNYDISYDIFQVDDLKYNESDYQAIIYYGDKEDKINSDITIIKANLFSDVYLKPESLPKQLQYIDDLPVFFFKSEYNFIEKVEDDKLLINNDIIQTVFFFLTCYEDYVNNDYDKYGRANINKSILYKNNLLVTPVVNKTINYFIDILNERFGLGVSLKPLWGDKDFAAILSHDVDAISKFLPLSKELRLQLSILLADRKPKLFLKRSYEFINKKINKSFKDPFDTFDYILNLEKQYNFKSSFYFMTDNKTYKTSDNATKAIIDKIRKYNCEIGFHPGLGTSKDKREFIEQKNLFLRDVADEGKYGIRQHYLSFISGITWEIQEELGVSYDTSICYPQVAGFKVGYCFPYRVYSLSQNKALDLWEIPLIVMEGTLLQYMNLDLEESKKYCTDLLSEIERYSGVFVLLWHNSALTTEYNPYAKALFEWLYEELLAKNSVVNSAANIINEYILSIQGGAHEH